MRVTRAFKPQGLSSWEIGQSFLSLHISLFVFTWHLIWIVHFTGKCLTHLCICRNKYISIQEYCLDAYCVFQRNPWLSQLHCSPTSSFSYISTLGLGFNIHLSPLKFPLTLHNWTQPAWMGYIHYSFSLGPEQQQDSAREYLTQCFKK